MVHASCLYLKFHSCVDVTRKTKHCACCWFSLVCFVCILSANLTITPDPISVSEGQNFSIKCISDVSNYDEVYWKTSAGIKIYQRFYTARRYPDRAESVLTVRSSTREWNGEWKASTILLPWKTSHSSSRSHFMQQPFWGRCHYTHFTDIETEAQKRS